MTLAPHYEGPRTPTEQEWPTVLELIRSIFFKDMPTYWDGYRRWPMSLYPTAREQALTIFQEGRPLSSIGRLERDMLVSGHRLQVGYLGSVCTHPDYRGQGLAGAILSATLRQLRADDVDVVFISGTRPMYFGAGANYVSIEERFLLGPEGVRAHAPEVQLRQASEADIDRLIELSEREGGRVIRPRLDWEIVLREGYCRGRESVFQLVSCQRALVGYLLVETDTRQNQLVVTEIAGERLCLLAALQHLCARLEGETRLQVNTSHRDLLAALLRQAGVHEEIGAKARGTMLIPDFARLMNKLVPYFQSRLPGCGALELRAMAGKDRYTAWCDGGYLQITGEASMLWLLLGKPALEETPGVSKASKDLENVQASGRMQELVERCLPLALPSLEMNTI